MSITYSCDELKISEYKDGEIDCVRLDGAENFKVSQIFDCGQCFRFVPLETLDGEYAVGGVAFGKYVEFHQCGKRIDIINTDIDGYERIWKHYLALDENYANIIAELKTAVKSDVFDRAVELGDGIRLLRQEPWECVCSFIISQNNNIPRIRKIISAMCKKYGEPIEFKKNTYYTFPSAQVLADVGADAIFELRTGFRAKYIFDAAKMVSTGELDFDRLFELSTEEAMKELCRVKGIGPKVASCALLFAFEKYDAFPIDVWVKKILEKYFSDGLDIASIGRYAGIAQQYLFFYERYVVSQKST